MVQCDRSTTTVSQSSEFRLNLQKIDSSVIVLIREQVAEDRQQEMSKSYFKHHELCLSFAEYYESPFADFKNESHHLCLNSSGTRISTKALRYIKSRDDMTQI